MRPDLLREALGFEKDAGRNPLVFFRGRYHTIGGEAPATAEAANAL